MQRVLVVGTNSPEHVGSHFVSAGEKAGCHTQIINSRQAWIGPSLLRKLSYHLLSKRPTALRGFSQHVLDVCRADRPDVLLATGLAPISASSLRSIGKLGVRRVCFLTDDPWNPLNAAAFFFEAMREYDTVYSPRSANIMDLTASGCREIRQLPFAFNPDVHFPEHAVTDEERLRFSCDIGLIGGADDARVALVKPLIESGFRVHLYGAYWHRFEATRAHYRGVAVGRELRLAVSGSLIQLCMGRAANRDGHAMRTYELPAMGACMLVEDTADHRALFGADGECVQYYRGSEDALSRARILLENPELRMRLSQAARDRVCSAPNTYAARLETIVSDGRT